MNSVPGWFRLYAAATRTLAIASAAWVLLGQFAGFDVVPAATVAAGSVLSVVVNDWALANRMPLAQGRRSVGRMLAPAWVSERRRD